MGSLFSKIVKEPLFIFLFFGCLLFIWFDKCNPQGYDGEKDTIIVSKEKLLTYMQYQSKAFQKNYFDKQYDSLSEEDRNQLITIYINEEVLYKEALKLQLEDNDYIIKRRLIQKIDFLYDNATEDQEEISKDSLLAFYNSHSSDYKVAPTYTFSHIYIKQGGRERASALLKEVQQAQLDANNSMKFGDRFLYHNHYVEREIEFIKSHFGETFAEAIKSIAPDKSQWSGPHPSEHGWHLVLLSNMNTSRVLTFEEVKSDVEEKFLKSQREEAKQQMIEQLLSQYKVVLDL